MKQKILLYLCFILCSFNGLAETHNLKDWVEYFNNHNNKIFYSSDFVSDVHLNTFLELDPINLNTFNQALHTLKLQLKSISNGIYVIQTFKNKHQGGLIIQAIDAKTKQAIKHFSLVDKGKNMQTDNGYILIESKQQSVLQVQMTAKGYVTKGIEIPLSKDKFRSINILLAAQPIQLSHVIVTASQFNINQPQTSLKSLNRTDIENAISVGNDPLSSVNTIAGNSTNGISGKTRTRGGNENEGLIIFDNNVLRNPYHFKQFFSLTSAINTSIVDGINFYSGVFPAKYGGRLSSAMEINSNDNLGQPKYEVGVDALNIYATYRYNNADYSRQFLSSIRSGGQLISSQLIEDSIIKPDFQDAYFKSSQIINSHWQASQHLLDTRDDTSFMLGDREDIPNDYEQALSENQNQNLWLQWHYDDLKNRQSNILFYANNKNDFRNGELNNDVSQSSVREEIKSHNFGIKYQQHNDLNDNWNIDFGIELFKESTDIKHALHINQNNQLLQQLALVKDFDRLLNFKNSGFGSQFYINTRYQLSKKIVFDAGFRFEYKDWIDENINSPRFNLSYFINDTTTVRVGLGRHQQSQYIDELLLEDENPEYFKPTSADVAVIELNKEINDAFSLRAEMYHKKYSHTQPYYENTFNNLHVLPDLYFDRSRITPDDSSASGLELTLFGTIKNIEWSGSYIYSDVHDEVDTINEEGAEIHQTQSRSWDQHQALKFKLHIPMHTWFLDIISNFHSGWPKTSINQTDQGYQIGQRNKDRFNQHTQIDVKLSKHIKTNNGLLKISLQASNIFNNANICCVNYTLEEGQLKSQEKQWLPIVPNFSVVYSWD